MDEDTNKHQYLLSCCHVLSDGASTSGGPIVQSGAAHGGTATVDQIASFTKALPLTNGSTCVGDAAIAQVDDPAKNVISTIRGLGMAPSGIRTLSSVGLSVTKSGDETGVTHGIVVGIKGTVGPFAPWPSRSVKVFFNDVIITSAMSSEGDSGSLLIDNPGQAVERESTPNDPDSVDGIDVYYIEGMPSA